MCSVCLHEPCSARCPNASIVTAAHRCMRCDEPIYPEDKYTETQGGLLCEECLSDMTAVEYLEYIGHELVTA